MRYARLYLRFLAIAIRSRMQYRSDMLVGMFSVFVLNAVNLALIWVMLSRFQSLGSWTYWEIVMLYSMWILPHSLYAIFFWQTGFLDTEILQGRFDQYMIRPMPPLLQFLGQEINYMGVGDIAIGVTIFTIAYKNLGLAWAPWQWGLMVVSVLSGTIIETCIFLNLGALSFWIGRSRSFMQAITTFNVMTQQWPVDIFGRWYRLVITGLLPVAFINYYPLTALLGKMPASGQPWMSYISPAVALLILGITTVVWRRGMANYASSGN